MVIATVAEYGDNAGSVLHLNACTTSINQATTNHTLTVITTMPPTNISKANAPAPAPLPW